MSKRFDKNASHDFCKFHLNLCLAISLSSRCSFCSPCFLRNSEQKLHVNELLLSAYAITNDHFPIQDCILLAESHLRAVTLWLKYCCWAFAGAQRTLCAILFFNKARVRHQRIFVRAQVRLQRNFFFWMKKEDKDTHIKNL